MRLWEWKRGYNLAYDSCNVTHLWYLIQTSGIGISLWNLLGVFLYIWIKHLSNFCSNYVKLFFVRRGQTSLLFSVLCPKPLLRRCPVPGPEQGLAPNLWPGRYQTQPLDIIIIEINRTPSSNCWHHWFWKRIIKVPPETFPLSPEGFMYHD